MTLATRRMLLHPWLPLLLLLHKLYLPLVQHLRHLSVHLSERACLNKQLRKRWSCRLRRQGQAREDEGELFASARLAEGHEDWRRAAWLVIAP